MALIENIIDTGGGESIQDMYDKLNALIDAFNNLGGGSAGQTIRKVDGNDFNFEYVDALKWKVFDIGDWNMNSAGLKSVVLTGVTIDKVRSIEILIRNDADAATPRVYKLEYTDFTNNGGSFLLQGSGVNMEVFEGGVFDNTDFNATSYNRGWITVGYVD